MTITPTPPTTDNKTANLADRIIKSLSNAGVATVETMIIADVPFLGWPVIKPLWEIPFGWVASYFTKAAENGATFAVIDLQVDHEESNLSAALKALIEAEKSGDAEAIKKAIQAYANAQSALVHSDGSSHAS